MTNKHIWRRAALAAATALALAACGDKAAQDRQKAAAAQEAPAPAVSVVTVQPQEVVLENELPGRLEAVRSATIVPQVSGVVKRRLLKKVRLCRQASRFISWKMLLTVPIWPMHRRR